MSHRHLARICCAMLACAAHTCLAGDPALSSLAMEHFRDTATVADDPIAGVTRVVTEKGYVEHHGLLRAVWNDEYLSANIDRKSGRRSFEVVATITYRGSRRDYGSAKFQGTNGPASAPATLVKATSVSCPTGECTYTDQISFGVEENLLRSLAARPAGEAPKLWHYTLVTKSNGDYAGALSSAEIAGFLAKVDEYTGAVPPPSMPNAPAVKPDLGLGGLRVEGTELQPERGGVLVTAVNRGSLAEKAGIIVGDIVREVDGHVVKTPPELQAAVAASHAPVTLKVYRGTAAITHTAAPGGSRCSVERTRPCPSRQAVKSGQPSPTSLWTGQPICRDAALWRDVKWRRLSTQKREGNPQGLAGPAELRGHDMDNTNTAPTYQSGKKSVAPSGAEASDTARAAAFSFLSGLAGELSTGTVDLPCFPDVVIRIRRALDDPKIKIEQTVTIVGSEPRLAAKLLQTANSAAFNTSGKPLTELKTAITRLGQKIVQSAAMAYAVQQMKEEQALKSVAQPLSELWNDSIAVASIAQVLARRTKVTSDEAFLTGLLHGIGRLYILVRSVGKASSLTLDSSFLDLVAGWHASIGKSVLENWGFAEGMAEAVGDQGEFDRRRKQADLTDVLVASIILGEVLRQPTPRTVDLQSSSVFQTIGLTQDDCTAILTHAEYQLGSLHEALGC